MNGWQIFVEVAGRPPFEVRPGESIVGRSRLAQVYIPESTVSRQHARILASPLGEVTVEDLGSANGTFVNNEKVEGRRRLADGDRIHVGDAELRVRIVAPVAPSEATVRMSLPPMGPPPAVAATPALAAAPPPVAASYATAPYAAPAAAPRPLDPPLYAPPRMAPPPTNPTAPTPQPPPAPIAPPPRPSPPPPPPTAPTPPAPTAPTPPAAPPPGPPPTPSARPSGRPSELRTPELPSVTVIDRIPIPDASPEVVRASQLSRAVPAGFGVRLAAFLIDAALITFVAIPLWIVAFFALSDNQAVAAFLVPAVMTFLSALYPILFWATKGATPGKIFLKLRVVGAQPGAEGLGWGPAIVRYLGYMVSGALLGIGFLLIAFTSQKQGLHDLIAGTRVVRLR